MVDKAGSGAAQNRSEGCPDVLQVLSGPSKTIEIKGNMAIMPFWATVGAPALAAQTGRWYWEAKFSGAVDPQVGWADRTFLDQISDAKEPHGVGDCVNSWAVDGMRQLRWHDGVHGDYKQTWFSDTVTVGCAISINEKLMLFSVNGVWDEEPAFTNVKFSGILFPCVSGEFASVTFSFLSSDLEYAPPASFLPLVPCQFLNAYNKETLYAGNYHFKHSQFKRPRLKGATAINDEARKQKQQEMAKKEAQRLRERRIKDKVDAVNALTNFKFFLKKMYGHLFRAWRRCLDPESKMILSKAELFKQIRNCHWTGDVRALWKALDRNNSGRMSFVDVDPQFARLLAFFKIWVDKEWGSADKVYRALDKNGTHKLPVDEFSERLQHFGYEGEAKKLFSGLDAENKKYLNEKDLKCIDNFKPPFWLTAKANPQAKADFKKLLLDRYNHLFKAWKLALDVDNSNCITFEEFAEAAESLGFNGDIAGAWLAFDDDMGGYITLSELDPSANASLIAFKEWAEKQFGSVAAGFSTLDEDGGGFIGIYEFIDGVQSRGFTGDAETLFDALDTEYKQELAIEDLRFLDEWVPLDAAEEKAAKVVQEGTESEKLQAMKRSNRMQELAKAKARWEEQKRNQGKVDGLKALADFKSFLKQKFGHPFHAWRKFLDVNETWELKKQELMKKCHDLGWKGNVNAMWKLLDADGSGQTTFEEIDQKFAARLAKFQKWLIGSFKNSQTGYRRLDTTNHHMLKFEEFEQQCRDHGFDGELKEVFFALDMEGKKFLTEKDFLCLDHYNPPAWLAAKPNAEACKKFKEILLQKYGHYLTAWRSCLDLSHSNCVDWHEFQKAAVTIGFDGDVPGAWLTLDEDHSGYISLHEIDENSSKMLLDFKSFCDERCGSTRAAFHEIDRDGSGSCTRKEFCQSPVLADFKGDLQVLFDAFDAGADHTGIAESNAKLSLDEVCWLDEWKPME